MGAGQLNHEPGEAQVDFGEALVKMAGVLRKVAFFAMVLPYSDAMLIVAFERECTETFWDGHVRAFAFFGGVPHHIHTFYNNQRKHHALSYASPDQYEASVAA